MKITDRFWSKVRPGSNGCLEWQANKNNHGYGLFRPGGSAPKQLAHRVAYELSKGTLHKGAVVRHSCDNPACVNPEHLLVGTQKQNVHDAIERKRHVNPPANASYRAKNPLLGESNPQSVLTEPEVREIWRLHFLGNTASAIATATGLSQSAVYDVCRGRTWGHLPGAPSASKLKEGGQRRGYNQFSKGGNTRAIHPRTKIPETALADILRRIGEGETMTSIGASYGVKKGAISKFVKSRS